MRTAQRMVALNRKQDPRWQEPPRLPAELRNVPIEDMPAAVEELLQGTSVPLREHLIEQLVWAVRSDEDDTQSRASIALLGLGKLAIMPIADQLLQKWQDTGYRVRLVRLLGEIGHKHREAMGPLMLLLSRTVVQKLLAAARTALMEINQPPTNPTAGSAIAKETSSGGWMSRVPASFS